MPLLRFIWLTVIFMCRTIFTNTSARGTNFLLPTRPPAIFAVTIIVFHVLIIAQYRHDVQVYLLNRNIVSNSLDGTSRRLL